MRIGLNLLFRAQGSTGGVETYVSRLVDAIITLAHTLKLTVIAEGVETKTQLKHLRRLNCDDAQGFLFCKPISVEEFTQRLMQRLSLTSQKKYDTSPLPNLAGAHTRYNERAPKAIDPQA